MPTRQSSSISAKASLGALAGNLLRHALDVRNGRGFRKGASGRQALNIWATSACVRVRKRSVRACCDICDVLVSPVWDTATLRESCPQSYMA
jgi:hypothetical protein